MLIHLLSADMCVVTLCLQEIVLVEKLTCGLTQQSLANLKHKVFLLEFI